MIVIKNISNYNIVINNKLVKPNECIKIDYNDLESIKNLLDNNLIRIIDKQELVFNNQSYSQKDKDLIEILYKFHINEELTKDELKELCFFFKEISPIRFLPKEIKKYLDNVDNQEHLIEILINQIYPLLISNFYQNQ